MQGEEALDIFDVYGLGAEFGAIFDSLWTHGDEKRLERIAEAKLADVPRGGIRR